MMQKKVTVLAVAPTTKGLGYAVLEGVRTLVDRGVKTVKQPKNQRSIELMRGMLKLFEPDVVVLEDAAAEGSRRSPRVRSLIERIRELARDSGTEVVLPPRHEVLNTFFPRSKGTNYGVAVTLAKLLHEDLESKLPAKRKLWETEHYRMSYFEAIALAVTYYRKRVKGKGAAGSFRTASQ
jgi:hypothetical protein